MRRRVGAPAAGQRCSPRLQVLDEERRARDAWLRANGWYGRELVLIQAGNFRSMSGNHATAERRAADDKAWPVQRWQQLFTLIHAQLPAALIVLCGASSEVPMLRSLRDAVGLDCVVVADPPLRQLFALCESAHSMISVDTGPAHAAAALGVPLVVLYGAESPAYWLPRGPAGTAVVGLGGPPRSTRVDQLSVEAVFEAWRSLPPRGQASEPVSDCSASGKVPAAPRARLLHPLVQQPPEHERTRRQANAGSMLASMRCASCAGRISLRIARRHSDHWCATRFSAVPQPGVVPGGIHRRPEGRTDARNFHGPDIADLRGRALSTRSRSVARTGSRPAAAVLLATLLIT